MSDCADFTQDRPELLPACERDKICAMGRRVLLLFQDGPATQSLLQAIVEKGHQASHYSGLRGVVERVLSDTPDLVLIALDRNDADGRDLARLMRKDARCAAIPVALCMQDAEAEAARMQMVALGAQGLVRPDRGTEDLALEIEDLLLRRRPLVPVSEQARLAKLKELAVLDTPPDAVLDAIVAAASAMAQAPIALISLVDAQRQWFKARVGLDASETPRDLAFCAHAIHGTEILEVPDSRQDERFAKNPLVQGAPHVIFYAGTPLTTSDGHAVGTLCIIDHVPRNLSDSQRESLAHLGRAVTMLLERGARPSMPLRPASPPVGTRITERSIPRP